MGKQLSEHEVITIRTEVARGESTHAVAKRHAVSSSSVSNIVTGRAYSQYGGPTHRPVPLRPGVGFKPGNQAKRRMTHERLDMARRLHASGMTIREIAKVMGFSCDTISRYLNGRYTI